MLVYVTDVWMDVGVLCFWCTDVLPDVLTSYCKNLFFFEVGCLWEFISLCFILWEFISRLVSLWGWVLSLFRCESLFLSVLFCGNLFFYLYFVGVYASDVLGDVSMFLVHYFWRCSFWSNAEVCYLLSSWIFMLKWKKVWPCGISLNFVCMVTDCFSQKISKGKDCWIFVCWPHYW